MCRVYTKAKKRGLKLWLKVAAGQEAVAAQILTLIGLVLLAVDLWKSLGGSGVLVILLVLLVVGAKRNYKGLAGF
jgi:uncharacterized membrane protein YtjA (UPF0391 family)